MTVMGPLAVRQVIEFHSAMRTLICIDYCDASDPLLTFDAFNSSFQKQTFSQIEGNWYPDHGCADLANMELRPSIDGSFPVSGHLMEGVGLKSNLLPPIHPEAQARCGDLRPCRQCQTNTTQTLASTSVR